MPSLWCSEWWLCCAESAESGGCAESVESGGCPECDGYHDCRPVAVVYNKESAQTLHAVGQVAVGEVAMGQVAVDDEERRPSISTDVHRSVRTKPDTLPSGKNPRSEGSADPAIDCVACWPTLLSMAHAKLSSHEAALCEERGNAGPVECPLLLAGEAVRTQTDASLSSQDAIRHNQMTIMEQRCHITQGVHVIIGFNQPFIRPLHKLPHIIRKLEP